MICLELTNFISVLESVPAQDAASTRKTALAAVYQQMRDMLAQDERVAQHEVDCELEVSQTKLRDLTKRLGENSERMKKAREDVSDLLSQSESLAFLQVGGTASERWREQGGWGRVTSFFSPVPLRRHSICQRLLSSTLTHLGSTWTPKR